MHRSPVLQVGLILALFLSSNPIFAQAPETETLPKNESNVIRIIYLENAHIKDVITMVRSLIGAKNVAVDEGLNAIGLRDTAENIELAEQIIHAQDVPRSEVVVDVKLIEFDTEELAGAEHTEGIPVRLSQDELERLEKSAGARLLLHPKLSLVAGQKAEFMAGDRVPIPIDNDGNISYQEVGFRLNLESRVHSSAAEVTLEFEMEMSHASTGAPGRPVIETKRIVSSVRLADGETYFLGGLTPGGPGSFAGEPTAESNEVFLALTPHITRRLDVRETPVRLTTAP